MESEVVEIREAINEDIDELCRLLGILFAQEREFLPDVERQRAGLERIVGDRSIGNLLVCVRDTRIVGMVNLLYTVSTALGARVALLEDMVVEPTARGRGVGKALLRAALDRCKVDGCKRVTLLTDHDNEAAHRFYESAEFERSTMVVFRRPLTRT